MPLAALCNKGGGIHKLSWLNIAAALILVFNPYFLDGIAYKYDSPGMAAAILFPLVPFLFLRAPRLYSVSSFLCLLGMYTSYQSASGIYIIMVIFAALLKYITEEWTLSETAKFCAKSAALFVAASAVFFLLSRFLDAVGTYRTTGVSVLSAPKNIAAYFASITRDFNGLWKALCVLAMLAAAFAACRLSKKKLFATLPLFIIALALALVLSQGAYIFLSDYFGAARGKYSFGALLAILASVSVLPLPSLKARWKRALAAAPAVLLAWSFFTYTSAFGNAHANQMKMELQYEALVRQDINELFSQEEHPKITIGFVGEMPWSGEVQGLAKAYPITKSVAQKRYPKSFPSFGSTVRYFDQTLTLITNLDDPPAPKEEMTLLLSRRYYNILLEDATGRVIVECKIQN